MRHQRPVNYHVGVKSEAEIIKWLNANGYPCTPSSKEDNVKWDIDAVGAEGTLYSIKTQHIAVRTGNLGFELAQLDTLAGEAPQWVKSWFHKGKACTYVILVGDTLWVMRKRDLAEWVRLKGWDSERTNTAQVVRDQRDHRFTDALNGLIKLAKLEHAGIALRLGTIR